MSDVRWNALWLVLPNRYIDLVLHPPLLMNTPGPPASSASPPRCRVTCPSTAVPAGKQSKGTGY